MLTKRAPSNFQPAKDTFFCTLNVFEVGHRRLSLHNGRVSTSGFLRLSHVGSVSGMRNEKIIKHFNLEYARKYRCGKTRMCDNRAFFCKHIPAVWRDQNDVSAHTRRNFVRLRAFFLFQIVLLCFWSSVHAVDNGNLRHLRICALILWGVLATVGNSRPRSHVLFYALAQLIGSSWQWLYPL